MLKKISIFLVIILITITQCSYSMAANDEVDTDKTAIQLAEDKEDDKEEEDKKEDDSEKSKTTTSTEDQLYKMPERNDTQRKKDGTLDGMITDAENFTEASTNTTNVVDVGKLQKISSNIYNIALEIGVGIAVIVGLFLGIRLMISGTEEKAEYKKMLWVYIVGCIVTFGAFGIWKIVVTVLEQI